MNDVPTALRDVPRTSMSREAFEWLEANPPRSDGLVSFDAASIGALRKLSAASYAAGVEAVRAEFSPTEESISLGGVSCLRVTAGARARPDSVILYFFGGGFHMGSPEEDLVVAAPMAAATGSAVVMPCYPLAPEHRHPAALDAARSVYEALLVDHDAADVAVAGESAGGNLALALCLSMRDDQRPMPSALGLMSPFADLTFSGQSHPSNQNPAASKDGLQDPAEILAGYVGDAPPCDPLVSPLFGDFTGFPATMITTGTRDKMLSDAVRVSNAMRCDGVDVSLRVWEGMWHVFEFYRELPEARASTHEVSCFLAAHLDPRA